jgi:hypothetical protein
MRQALVVQAEDQLVQAQAKLQQTISAQQQLWQLQERAVSADLIGGSGKHFENPSATR